jgi:hypothetical protein
MAAGVTNTAAAAANATTATPAYVNDLRNDIGNNTSAIIDSATVIAEKNSVRPALVIVWIKASSRPAPSANSSRNRLTISSV